MSARSTRYDSFRELRKGKYDWKVPARIINFWRGYTKLREPFKGFNLMLLDHKGCRIHAFVPSAISEAVESKIIVGGIYVFTNFTVKDYKSDDKFRCMDKDIQIIFGSDTHLKQLEEKAIDIEYNAFDFSDLADLEPLAKQNVYLTDVIGVMEEPEPLGRIYNRFGVQQSQLKFRLTDGIKTINVTFWDTFAEQFDRCMKEATEFPIILIIASGRVTKWQEVIDISNVGCTCFYINYQHHSVTAIRKSLKSAHWKENSALTQKHMPPKVYTVKEIKNLRKDYTQTEILCQVKITNIQEMEKWYYFSCTSCYKEIEKVDENYICKWCINRIVPNPDKKFIIYTVATDASGRIEILLIDREVRTIIGKSVWQIEKEEEKGFPKILKTILNRNYTIKLLIRESNINKKALLYEATDIMDGFDFSEPSTQTQYQQSHDMEDSVAQPSGSSYHLDNYTQMTNVGPSDKGKATDEN